MMKFKRVALVCGLWLSAVVAPSMAQEWPTQPIRIVHPGAAGGGVDAMTRVLGEALSKRLKVPFLSEPKPGAGTIVAAQSVASAPPDGYRLLMSSVSTMAVTPWLYKSLPYDVTRSFQSIARLSTAPNVFVASPRLPVKTMAELVSHGRAHPGALNIGSIGLGTTSHLVGAAVIRAAGITATNVPFRGAAEMTLALAQGEIQLAAQDLGGLIGQIKSGALRALANTGERRHPDLPDVPTMAELNMSAADLSVWYGLEAPAGTPPAVVAKIAAAVADAMQDPDVIERYRNFGAMPAYLSPTAYTAFRLDELKRYQAVVAASGAKIE